MSRWQMCLPYLHTSTSDARGNSDPGAILYPIFKLRPPPASPPTPHHQHPLTPQLRYTCPRSVAPVGPRQPRRSSCLTPLLVGNVAQMQLCPQQVPRLSVGLSPLPHALRNVKIQALHHEPHDAPHSVCPESSSLLTPPNVLAGKSHPAHPEDGAPLGHGFDHLPSRLPRLVVVVRIQALGASGFGVQGVWDLSRV